MRKKDLPEIIFFEEKVGSNGIFCLNYKNSSNIKYIREDVVKNISSKPMLADRLPNKEDVIEDLKQVIFKQKTDFEMQKWEQSKKDLAFLKELQGRMKNWDDKNDLTERDYAFKMVEDWIDELDGVVNVL